MSTRLYIPPGSIHIIIFAEQYKSLKSAGYVFNSLLYGCVH